MKHLFLTVPSVIFLCVACATPDTLKKRDMRGITSLSLAISTTIAVDVSGFTDSVDLPLSKKISEKLLELTKTTLRDKHYQVADQHVSIGSAYSKKKLYVVASDLDRKRKLRELEKKAGPYHTDRLTKKQLAVLYKNLKKHKNIPMLTTMGFQGDATLVMHVRGRLIGKGKSLGASLANAAIMTTFIAGGGGSFGGSPRLNATGDNYQVQMRLYSTKSGDILWQSDIKKADDIEKVSQEMTAILKERIPVN